MLRHIKSDLSQSSKLRLAEVVRKVVQNSHNCAQQNVAISNSDLSGEFKPSKKSIRQQILYGDDNFHEQFSYKL